MTQIIESVWDYPRPPRLEPCARRIQVVHAGITVADTISSLRILETSHPPVYYIPPQDVVAGALSRSPRRSTYCEFKGMATYWSLALGRPVTDAAWSYPEPTARYAALRDHLAFYASRVDECLIDGEKVQAQEGDFYGGWITSHVRGPFKGAPGTLGW
jgi:uncharacterized protein (DUF427 family)